MAARANIPRKASADLLLQHIQSLKLVCGMLAKTTRAYTAGDGSLTQAEVEASVGLPPNTGTLTRFENGSFIPDQPLLNKLLSESGFDLDKPKSSAYSELLDFLRDHAAQLDALPSECPE